MISLLIWAGLLLSLILLLPWATARGARAVGSPRGRYWVAAGAIVVVCCLNAVVGFLIESFVKPDTTHPALQLTLQVLCGIAVIFFVFQCEFRLSFARTFAPFAAYLALIGLYLGAAIGIIRPFVTESFMTPARSMVPTINPGDRCFVNKVLQPRRFDLVAYWSHCTPEPQLFCKRLIALPGERLRFEKGGIFINDQAVDVPPVLAGRCRASTPGAEKYCKYKEGQTITLGTDEYFFIGDNIDISGDSRHEGPSDHASLVGVVDLIYWPLARSRIVR